MKNTLLICFLVFGASAAQAGVTLCAPSSGTRSGYPITVELSAPCSDEQAKKEEANTVEMGTLCLVSQDECVIAGKVVSALADAGRGIKAEGKCTPVSKSDAKNGLGPCSPQSKFRFRTFITFSAQ